MTLAGEEIRFTEPARMTLAWLPFHVERNERRVLVAARRGSAPSLLPCSPKRNVSHATRNSPALRIHPFSPAESRRSARNRARRGGLAVCDGARRTDADARGTILRKSRVRSQRPTGLRKGLNFTRRFRLVSSDYPRRPRPRRPSS